jgi:hypothetical protein
MRILFAHAAGAAGQASPQVIIGGAAAGMVGGILRAIQAVAAEGHEALARIADILCDRGRLDEALAIRREQELPVYQRLGDVRSAAITQGKIADILYDRGRLDQALAIRRDEELPVYKRLGDVRSAAVTQGSIAHILHARGRLDEALAIRRDEELPVFQELGDVRGQVVCRTNIALTLLQRGRAEDAQPALDHLLWSHRTARQLGLREAGQIDAQQATRPRRGPPALDHLDHLLQLLVRQSRPPSCHVS